MAAIVTKASKNAVRRIPAYAHALTTSPYSLAQPEAGPSSRPSPAETAQQERETHFGFQSVPESKKETLGVLSRSSLSIKQVS